MKTLEARIKEFHQNRQQPTIELKYKRMADNEFAFFRATCHLFYEDLAKETPMKQGPTVWACGDLHLENFGSYRAANGLVYFDINDFDEAALAPAPCELVRFLCSIAMASDLWKYSSKEAEELMLVVLKAYTRQLAEGKAYTIERETSPSLIQEFFEMAERQKEKELIKERVDRKKEKLKIIKGKTFSLDKKTYQLVRESVNDFLKEHYGFLKVKDVAFRIAGTGSLGVKRYVLLVRDSRQDKLRLLDVKQALPSSLAPYINLTQPKWSSDAERVVTAQGLMQYALPRFIGIVPIGDEKFILKQLQPTSQKIDHTLCNKKMKNVETVMTTMAQALASAQIRSASRKGSADVESLMKFSIQSLWQANLIQTAVDYSLEMKNYFREYKELFKKGKMRR
ncbi:MAG TPA: DUF2252 family protein [Cyclobacteriaceae bacterium]|jgi:uncharacterized protein (DUF2252 family)|nr:DUF2252 family protein [Cyclobacteriaceae bacterium]